MIAKHTRAKNVKENCGGRAIGLNNGKLKVKFKRWTKAQE